MTLKLKPVANAELLQLSLRGTLSKHQTPTQMRLLMAGARRWSGQGVVAVVLSADDQGRWDWALPWAETLEQTMNDFSVRFAVRGGCRASR